MKKIVNCILILFVLFAIACKKDNGKDTDVVSTQNIHGQVFNLCTDSGLVNCTVFLKENGNTIAQLNSGTGGNFTFNSVQIHSSSSYSYAVETIDNPDGGGGLPAISGGIASINKENLSQMYVLKVIPIVIQWFLYFPNGTVDPCTDTVLLTLQQKVFHKNYPSGNYFLTLRNSPTFTYTGSSNYIGDPAPYWMGWWYSTLTRTKNGIKTIKADSFYLPWVNTVTDTIPWQ